MKLEVFTDASLDTTSTAGTMVKINGTTIIAKCKRIAPAPRSAMEAELAAMSDGLRQGQGIRQILVEAGDLDQHEPVVIKADNAAACAHARGFTTNGANRHFVIQIRAARSLVEQQLCHRTSFVRRPRSGHPHQAPPRASCPFPDRQAPRALVLITQQADRRHTHTHKHARATVRREPPSDTRPSPSFTLLLTLLLAFDATEKHGSFQLCLPHMPPHTPERSARITSRLHQLQQAPAAVQLLFCFLLYPSLDFPVS